ncbi:MAG TPA: O-antigen ligase family protein [Oscillatoriaceae cyanobacterium]
MLETAGTRRPPWMINLLAVVLVLVASGVLIVVFHNGPPSRTIMAGLLGVLVLTPVLMRWQTGWLILFALFPVINLIRRAYYLAEIHLNDVSFNDLFVALPDAVALLTVVGFVLSLRVSGKDGYDWGDTMIARPLKLLIGLSLLEIFNPLMGSTIAGLNGFRQFTLYALFYFVTQAAVRSRAQLSVWFKMFLIIGALSGAYGAFQYIFGFPVYDQMWAQMYAVTNQTIGDQMRAFSSFSFTSTFSHYMVVAASAALVALRMKRIGTFTRLLSPFFLVCMLLGLAVTFVRSSYVGLLVAGLVGLVMTGRPSGRWKRLIFVAALSAVLVGVMPHSHGDSDLGLGQQANQTGQLVANRIESLTRPTDVGSMSIRFAAWQQVIHNSTMYPMGAGLGIGASSRFTGNYGLASIGYTESQLFSMLAELGYPGLILYVWVVLAGMLFAMRVHDRLQDPDLRMFAVFSLMVQAGMTVLGLTGGAVLYTLPGSACYWAAMGFVSVLPRIEAEEKAREEKLACAA